MATLRIPKRVNLASNAPLSLSTRSRRSLSLASSYSIFSFNSAAKRSLVVVVILRTTRIFIFAARHLFDALFPAPPFPSPSERSSPSPRVRVDVNTTGADFIFVPNRVNFLASARSCPSPFPVVSALALARVDSRGSSARGAAAQHPPRVLGAMSSPNAELHAM
jgi:hypothetical protein|tara:strand:- start:8106 stop:8597 length:492 start_codon:yes stop_codon:yes gene_type:complete